MTETRRGLFITFEGIDGSGKTTQMHRLAARLREAGHEVLETYEPGGTPIGVQVRRILLDAANQELCATSELLLYFACRAQNVVQSILPALREGKIVLSDRFTDSTLVYQGVGRGLGTEVVLALDRICCQGLRPDLTLLVDIDLETSLARAHARNRTLRQADHAFSETRMDDQAADFHQRVRKAYLELAAGEPQRVTVVDGRGDVASVEQAVWNAVAVRLGKLHV
ncbi:MAG: dTMP kinase [Bryobacterales bacterium]|nr:dTMP kinase [Bryobacterales bacterium]